jgi:hypothetical protein
MLDVKRVVFGLAAIVGLGCAIPSARAALPDDGQVVSPLPDSARQTPVPRQLAISAPDLRRGGSSGWEMLRDI